MQRLIAGFQLIRFDPIGRVLSVRGTRSNPSRFQLIRFDPIGRAHLDDYTNAASGFQLIRFDPIGREFKALTTGKGAYLFGFQLIRFDPIGRDPRSSAGN